MGKMIIIEEHGFIEDIKLSCNFTNKIRDPNSGIYGYNVCAETKKDIRFLFYQDKKPIYDNENNLDQFEDCYRASYLIGAQYIKILRNDIIDNTKTLIITPKFTNIDYSEMFMTCLNSGLESSDFSKLYHIDIDTKDPYIKAPSVSSVLNPLLIAHFLFLVEKLLKSGLKKDYSFRSENIKKAKGKINVRKNILKNIVTKRYDRIYCDYSVYSVDIPENRIIKKALLFVERMMKIDCNSNSFGKILNKALNQFDKVSNDIELSEIRQIKNNKLYKEYPETVRLAKMILKRFGYSISNIEKSYYEVPPFWIDMAGLFEHYTLVKLTQRFGRQIVYQFDENVKFRWRPDFLLKKGENNLPMILDAKYKLNLKKKLNNGEEAEIVRQLSGYSRETTIRQLIGAEEELVACTLIYPAIPDDNIEEYVEIDNIEFTKEGLRGFCINGLIDFYAIPIEVPMLKIGP